MLSIQLGVALMTLAAVPGPGSIVEEEAEDPAVMARNVLEAARSLTDDLVGRLVVLQREIYDGASRGEEAKEPAERERAQEAMASAAAAKARIPLTKAGPLLALLREYLEPVLKWRQQKSILKGVERVIAEEEDRGRLPSPQLTSQRAQLKRATSAPPRHDEFERKYGKAPAAMLARREKDFLDVIDHPSADALRQAPAVVRPGGGG
jgi:hypothetical protein